MTNGLTPRGLMLAAVTALCGGIGIALIKVGLGADSPLSLAFISGIAIYGVGVLCGIALLAVYPISVAYPVVVGLSLAVLGVLSSLWLGETLTAIRLLGTALVGLGVVLLVRVRIDRSDVE